jgi:excisionase family DNA binding protein
VASLDSTTTQSPWLDVDGAAAYLNSKRDVVRRWAKQRLLPGYQPNGPGSRWYFHRNDLDATGCWASSITASSKRIAASLGPHLMTVSTAVRSGAGTNESTHASGRHASAERVRARTQ